MTRNLKKIAQALAAKGFTLDEAHAYWTPINGPYEMDGYQGGWYVEFEPPTDSELSDRNAVYGYNLAEVMEMIAEMPTRQDQTP